MKSRARIDMGRAVSLLSLSLVLAGCAEPTAEAPLVQNDHAALVELWREWRDFERPTFNDGVPDYTASAMARQFGQLPGWMDRLAAFDLTGWSVEESIDWQLVRAEMNGLDFDHQIRRPWARDPAFYVTMYPSESDVPAHEGPVIHGWIDTWTYDYPLSSADAAERRSVGSARRPTLRSEPNDSRSARGVRPSLKLRRTDADG